MFPLETGRRHQHGVVLHAGHTGIMHVVFFGCLPGGNGIFLCQGSAHLPALGRGDQMILHGHKPRWQPTPNWYPQKHDGLALSSLFVYLVVGCDFVIGSLMNSSNGNKYIELMFINNLAGSQIPFA